MEAHEQRVQVQIDVAMLHNAGVYAFQFPFVLVRMRVVVCMRLQKAECVVCAMCVLCS